MGAERGAGDDPERLLADPRDGEVGLDAAALVEQLRVDGRADRLVDVVGAQPVRAHRDAPGPAMSSFANEDWSKSAGGVARRDALGADRRRPVAARPAVGRDRSRSPAAAFESNQLTRSQPAFSPKLASRSREAGRRPAGSRSGRPAGRSSRGIDDVVVARVGVERADPRVAAAARSARRSGGCPSPRDRRTACPRRSTRPSPCRRRPPRRARGRRIRRRPRARRPRVSPRMNSPSGVNASGPLTTLAISAPRSARDPPLRALPGLGEPLHVGLEQRPRVAPAARRRPR